MAAYYNEHDPFPAAWLRELIKADLIAPGEVDERDIQDVKATELRGFTQCHFFAGIGGWSCALRLAGWPDSRPVWTASLPCQPWSIANVWHGGGRGREDERHLLPHFCELVGGCKPHAIFGEQVSGAIAKGWLDELSSRLGAEGYAIGALVLPVNAFGADHERKRLYWAADAGRARWEGHQPVECLPEPAEKTFTISRDNFLRARRVMANDYDSLLPCDGLSVVMERSALKGYGNAIVPPVAAEFIEAYQGVSVRRTQTKY